MLNLVRGSMTAIALLSLSCLYLGAQNAGGLIYTDRNAYPGGVFHQGDPNETTLFQATTGRIYAAAVGPGNTLFTSDFNDFDVERHTGVEDMTVFTHTTYLRDVAFDKEGSLYFSQSSGAGADGRIYRMENGAAVLYRTVPLSQVHGFWSGYFNFAPNGDLYVSTGNRIGSHIYRFNGSAFTSIYYDPSGAICGFDFDDSGNIYYANWMNTIYKLTPGLVRTTALSNPARYFADVSVPKEISIGPEAGRVNAVAWSSTPDVAYAASSSGGFYRSHDLGETWMAANNGLTDPRLGEILVYPHSRSTLLACTPSGVFRSTDEGKNWNHELTIPKSILPPNLPLTLQYLESSPMAYDSVNNFVYAAPYGSGLYRSPDGGLTWSQVFGTGNMATDMVLSITASNAPGNTVYFTTPGQLHEIVAGGSANPLTTNITEDPVIVRFSPSDPDIVYVTAFNLSSSPIDAFLWKRTSPGGSFAKTTLTPPWMNWDWLYAMSVHPTNSDHVLVGSPAAYRSTNGGVNLNAFWCSSSPTCGVDYHDFEFNADGTEFFAAHDQGLYHFDSLTGTYRRTEKGMNTIQAYTMDVGPGGVIYLGTQDNGSYKWTSSSGWNTMGGGDCLSLVVDPTNDQHVFRRNNSSDIYRSTNGGSSWLSTALPMQYFRPNQLVYDQPTTTLYAGTRYKGIYKSTDDGATFNPANTGITTLKIASVGMAPGVSSRVYAGSFVDGIYKSTNSGGSWTKLTNFPEPGALVIRESPTGEIFAGTANGVFTSADGGTSWNAANNGLPAEKVVSQIMIDPLCSCRMYVGLGFYSSGHLYKGGVYESTNGGGTWNLISSSRGETLPVTAIKIDPTDRSQLLVATYGGSVMRLFRDISGGCPCP